MSPLACEILSGTMVRSSAAVASTMDGFLEQMWSAVGGTADGTPGVLWVGAGALPSLYPVTELAAGSVGVAAAAVAELVATWTDGEAPVQVDRRLASFWFRSSIRPEGWQLPPPWDALAGDYRAADGWIRLHTNAPHHRAAALAALAAPPERDAVARAVAGWRVDALEQAVVAQGGCAAALRTTAEWLAHPQGRSVALEPLVHHRRHPGLAKPRRPGNPSRPLAGVRVLDLTRVLAGPVATRFLAGFGAEVLRIDPPGWDEPGVIPEMTLGKRCARLDLRQSGDRERLARLIQQCDVLVHGYRADALERLGLGAQQRAQLNPGLVDVSLNAYGWTGPWRNRRGFDSLVQMSSGIAAVGEQGTGPSAPAPVPLPVQALDHATGYLLAAAAVRGLAARWLTGAGCEARASLARTASMLLAVRRAHHERPVREPGEPLAAETADDLADGVELTAWGPARRLRPPAEIDGIPMRWDTPAQPLGTSDAAWQTATAG